jgi:RNA polymerase sigma-70 factor (ECF subfamily)
MRKTSQNVLTRVTLLQRLRNQHDDGAWEEFAETYRSYIYAVARAMDAKHADCEDIVQTVLVKLWKFLPKFDYDRQRGTFRAWLATVTRNAVRTHYGKVEKRPDAMDPAMLDAMREDMDDDEMAEFDAIAEREWKQFIGRRAWSLVEPQLSDAVRQAFLKLSAGEDSQEVAAELGIERNTAYVYRKRVEHRLFREIRRLELELG